MGRQTNTGAIATDESYANAAVVAPSDTIGPAQRLHEVRGVFCDVGGTLKVITEATAVSSELGGGALSAARAVSFTVPTGTVLPLAVAYVLATGTAATGIKVLF